MNQPRTILQCPKCATMVAFEQSTSNLIACSCGSVLQRINNELKVEPELNTVTVKGYQIKPGTTGEWEKGAFKVLGKMGVWFEESFFSYWSIVFNDGRIGYLAEGYGIYSILLPEKNAGITQSDLATSRIGQVASLTNSQLQKKNSCYYWEVEGEIYFESFNAYFDVYEYASASGMLYTIFRCGNAEPVTFINYPVLFDELQLNNIQAKDPFGITLKCPQCFKEIKVLTYPLAQSCTCNGCGTFYAIEKRQPVKKGNNKNNLFDPLLAIGATGTVKNISYQVVGFAQKKEQNEYNSKWREYVLFNPTYGFAFLSEFDGHWIYVKETIAAPVILNDTIKAFELEHKTFRLFNSYSYTVVDAKGEFPYNIFDNKNTQVKEYISPPAVWIREKDSKEGITWFYGEHITAKEIKQGFVLSGSIPYRVGVGAVQPTGYISINKLLQVLAVGIGILLLAHVFFLSNKREKIISEGNYYFADSSDKTKSVSEKFDLDVRRSDLSFQVSAPVNNTWFELDATLVNVETGKEYSMQQGVEFYFGYTEGENWTEGTRIETAYITNIPAGKYFLEMEGTRETNSFNKINDFYVKVEYDARSYRNFWFAVLLLLIWPLINFIRNIYSEKSRWENSPYSNYNTL